MFRNAILAAALAAASWPALADPLPNGARPLGAKALHTLYSGTTLNWATSRAWFAPDGTLKSVAGKEGQFRDCWTWFKGADGRPWTLWSVHFDGTPPDTRNGYYQDEIGKMRRGDGVSALFDRLWKG